ncbi:Serine/threonine-protein kinase WNK (With No Lysine)-related [Abeliophyllum distichum]|uniref:Serine/threonine-protein kinase WNK (With No Lysine)-related n=1 Tax=Abeliophyllum distichum TaxID=126358 RepID=A0ABD1RUW4_9LAMI
MKYRIRLPWYFDKKKFRPNEVNRVKISLTCVFALMAIGRPLIILKTGIMGWIKFWLMMWWDSQGGVYDRSRGNRRNMIFVWEDGFCNFSASTTEINPSECQAGSLVYEYQHYQGLQPELFFKMSHEIYNYGEGKYKYELQKKKRDQQKTSLASRMDLKELKMGYKFKFRLP